MSKDFEDNIVSDLSGRPLKLLLGLSVSFSTLAALVFKSFGSLFHGSVLPDDVLFTTFILTFFLMPLLYVILRGYRVPQGRIWLVIGIFAVLSLLVSRVFHSEAGVWWKMALEIGLLVGVLWLVFRVAFWERRLWSRRLGQALGLHPRTASRTPTSPSRWALYGVGVVLVLGVVFLRWPWVADPQITPGSYHEAFEKAPKFHKAWKDYRDDVEKQYAVRVDEFRNAEYFPIKARAGKDVDDILDVLIARSDSVIRSIRGDGFVRSLESIQAQFVQDSTARAAHYDALHVRLKGLRPDATLDGFDREYMERLQDARILLSTLEGDFESVYVDILSRSLDRVDPKFAMHISTYRGHLLKMTDPLQRVLAALEAEAERETLDSLIELRRTKLEGQLALERAEMQRLSRSRRVLVQERRLRAARLLAKYQTHVAKRDSVYQAYYGIARVQQATVFNAVRETGIGIFVLALLCLVVGYWFGVVRPAADNNLKEDERARLAYERNTYYIGFALILFLLFPQFNPIDEKSLIVGEPLSSFTNANWYLPQYLQQTALPSALPTLDLRGDTFSEDAAQPARTPRPTPSATAQDPDWVELQGQLSYLTELVERLYDGERMILEELDTRRAREFAESHRNSTTSGSREGRRERSSTISPR